MQPVSYIWMDGRFIKWNKAKVHILTHTLHYGSGVFEGIRCYTTDRGPAVFRLLDHLKRMENSARLIGIKLPYAIPKLRKAIKELIKKNKIEACYIRPIAYYGYGVMGLDPRGSPVKVAIALWPWGAYLGEKELSEGVKVRVSKWRRIDKRTVPTVAKVCGYYINSILAHNEAIAYGCKEAILLNTEGYVAEGPGENIFIVKNGILITPPISAGILPGITRNSVIQIAKDEGIEVVERNITKQQLLSADEVFFTGTAAEISPIREIDGKIVGSGKRGPVTQKLQKIFFDAVKGKIKKYEKWLDFV